MTDTKLEPELPKLPKQDITFADHSYPAFSAKAMQAYARAAIEADRKRSASVVSDKQIYAAAQEHQTAFTGRQVSAIRALLSAAPRVLEGFVLMPKEQIERALDVVQDTMQAAYQNGYQVCCGRMGEECCGAPDADWSPADHRIMDALSPAQRELSALLAAAPQPTQEG